MCVASRVSLSGSPIVTVTMLSQQTAHVFFVTEEHRFVYTALLSEWTFIGRRGSSVLAMLKNNRFFLKGLFLRVDGVEGVKNLENGNARRKLSVNHL